MSFDDIKGGDKETTQTTQPWGPSQDALKDILGQGGQLFSQGQQSLGQRSNADLYNPASNTLRDLVSGNTLDVTHSPMWGSMVGGIQDAVNSQFSSAGRTGSPAHAGVMTSELGKLAGSLWGQERGRQMQGISMLPGLYNFGNADLDSLWQNLSRYSGLAQGVGGMGGTTAATGGGGGMLGDLLGSISSIIGLGSGDDANIFSDGRSAAPYAQDILNRA